jgi:hypothetical protein
MEANNSTLMMRTNHIPENMIQTGYVPYYGNFGIVNPRLEMY